MTARQPETGCPRVIPPVSSGLCGQEAASRLANLLGGPIVPPGTAPQKGDIILMAGESIRRLHAEHRPEARPESYAVAWQPQKTSILAGQDEQGLLRAVSDLAHHYRDQIGKPFNIRSSPAIRMRGLWSWARGIYDVRAYIMRMAWWKLNTLVLWNDVPPSEAQQWQQLCDRLGVNLYWGFSWGWNYPDCTPREAKRLRSLLEDHPSNGTLPCPSQPESRRFVRDYVLRHFEQHYAPIGARAIYCQTFTEQPKCPCPRCRSATTGQLLLDWIAPVTDALLSRYPHLQIACGVHNTMEDFQQLRRLDPRCAIIWERETLPDKAYPASSIENARKLACLRGRNERCALLFRLYGDYGLNLRGNNDPDLHARIARNWHVLATGEGTIENAQVHNLGIHPVAGRWLQNAHVRKLREWIAAAAAPDIAHDGVVGLLEGSMWSVIPRPLPALFAEMAWYAGEDDPNLETRMQAAARASNSCEATG